MRKSQITADFTSDIETVWGIVTNNKEYAWRTDLEEIKISEDGNTFVEYAKGGFQTKFTITKKVLYQQYEFNMDNKNFTGYWTGTFSKTKMNGTQIVFIETINIKNPLMQILSYLFMNLKKMQITYVNDLKKQLGEV